MRRGSSLQSWRSKAVGDPTKGSPQDAWLLASRPRSSSTDGTCSPNHPDGLLVTGEESDRLEQAEVGGPALSPVALSFGADGPPHLEESDGAPGPHRSRQLVAQLRQKILKLTEQIKVEQAARDNNVAEYLELAHSASDRQQVARIKQAFEKKNQRSAQGLQQLQRKLERCHRRLCDAERGGSPRQPVDGLQGVRDVGGRVASSQGVSSQPGGAAMLPRARESAGPEGARFSSTDNIAGLKDNADENRGEERPAPCYDSDDDCSSATSGSAGGANSTSAGPGAPHSSKVNAHEGTPGLGLETLLCEVREVREAQGRLIESLENLKTHYQRDYTFILQALQEERYRCEHLEEQLSDLTELHQNEILILKQELASMEEKVAYQSYEQGRDVQEALEACQTRVFKMEQQQQQAAQQEDPERAAVWTLLGKLVNALLVAVSAAADLMQPLIRTFGHSGCMLCLLLLLVLLWRGWYTGLET